MVRQVVSLMHSTQELGEAIVDVALEHIGSVVLECFLSSRLSWSFVHR